MSQPLHRNIATGRTSARPHALALYLHLAIAGIALAGPLAITSALAVETAGMAAGHYSIPPGPLGDVLARFAATSGIRLSFDPALVAGQRSSGLQGRHTTRDGLERILENSGFELVDVGNGAYTLRKQAQAAWLDAAQLAPVMVHGSLGGDPLEERMSLSAAKIIVGQEEIERFGDASMGEVIRRMPSVSFGGPPGENNDARIRGLGKEYTQILIDGQPVPGREFAIDQIPAHMVERIEIIRTTTANIDNQGIAGTVNIILKKLPDARVAKWSAGLGTMPDAPGDGRMWNLGATYGNGDDRFRYQLDATGQNRFGVRTKDRRDFANGLGVMTNRENDFEVREHSEGALSARLNWQLDAQDSVRLDPRLTYSREDKRRDRLKKADLSDAERMEQVKTREYFGLNGQWQRTLDADARYTLGFNLQRIDIDTDKHEFKGKAGQPFSALPNYAGGNDDRIREDGVSVRATTQQRVAEIHALDLGVELFGNSWQSDKVSWKQRDRSDAASNRFSVREHKLAAYVQDEILIGERHVFTPGLRAEYVRTRVRANDAAYESSSDLQTSPSLHWLSNLDDVTNWRASVSRSIRRPKFDDLAAQTELRDGTLDKPDKAGNPGLAPESTWAVESSLERYFDDRAGVASVNVFHRYLHDLIEKEIDVDGASGRFVERPVNTARARTWGIEFDGSYRFRFDGGHGLTLRGNYSRLKSATKDATTGRSRPINDQPDYILNAGIDYEYRPWKMQLGTHYNRVGRLQKADLAGSNQRLQRQRPSQYLDAFVRFELAKDLHLRISGTNLLEAEKIRPRVTTRPDGSIALVEQEDEYSARAFFVRLEGRF